MYKWLLKKVNTLRSTRLIRDTPGEGINPMDLHTIAQLVVVYNIQDGSNEERLVCSARSKTIFTDNVNDLTKTLLNTASQMLVDNHNLAYVYTSILSNMLHVPTELREKPN